MIAVIDYGRGNLASVSNSLKHLNIEHEIVTTPEALRAADAIILPGVGAWDDAVTSLSESGMLDCLREELAAGKPYLGICLGMHLLFAESEEGTLEGLRFFEGKVRRFHFRDAAERGLKVPHTGWNRLSVSEDDPLMVDGSEVYFSHSYYVIPEDKSIISAVTDYGGSFCAAVRHSQVEAMQFHPEKSGTVGLQILKRFANRIQKNP